MSAVDVIVWTCTVTFVATALITLLALVGKVTLGGGDGSQHRSYMKWLFSIFIAEIVGASVFAFGEVLRVDSQLLDEQADALEKADSLLGVAQTAFLSNELRVDSLVDVTAALRTRPLGQMTITALPARDTVVRAPRTQEIVREVSATASGDGTESKDLRIPIPPGWAYVDHLARVTSRNGNGSFTERLERGPDGEVSSVLISAQATSASRNPLRILSPPRSWISVEVTVQLREAGR